MPTLDKNQLKAGWKCLTKLAVHWKVESEAAETLCQLQWESCLPTIAVGPWTVLPLTDAWQLREEALRQHHCVDHYIEECLAGNRRFFSARNARGYRVATIGIAIDRHEWRSLGIRGVANTPVWASLEGLDDDIAQRYTDIWRLGQPVPPPADEGSESDATVLWHLEERLGVTFNRDDPMLGAAISLERSLMQMMEERRTQ